MSDFGFAAGFEADGGAASLACGEPNLSIATFLAAAVVDSG